MEDENILHTPFVRRIGKSHKQKALECNPFTKERADIYDNNLVFHKMRENYFKPSCKYP